MLKRGIKITLLSALVVLFIASMVGQAKAQIVFEHDFEISGGTDPQGSTPWVTATFVDVSPDNVRLTMSGNNLVGTEFITGWYFSSNVSTSGLTFTPFDITDINSTAPTINLGSDSFKADGDGYFDIKFDFQTSNNPMVGRFQAGETVIYDISGTSLSASSFNELSAPDGAGTGLYHSVAKVQGINGNDSTSGWVANTTVVPEPISSTLFIVGAATLGYRRFWKKRKIS